MFDTVVYSVFLALRPTPADEKLCPPGWKRTDFTRGSDKFPTHYDFKLENPAFGVRVFGLRDIIRKVEAELPKLLYGHNGRLLSSQPDVDLALSRLKAVLSIIATPYSDGSGFFPGDQPNDLQAHYTRIDLVWQFALEPAVMLLALKYAKHPEINRPTANYEGQTIFFRGTQIQIAAYDKKAQLKSKQDQDVVRIEVRYQDEKLHKHFCQRKGERYLKFEAAYKVYREALLGFNFMPILKASEKGTLSDFLAWVASQIPEQDVVGSYCAMKRLSPRKSRELRKDVGKRVPAVIQFSWEDLLPPQQVPPVINIPMPEKEKNFEDLLGRFRFIPK